jgi:hypothetical protein
MTPPARKALLVGHIVSSVGWLGGVVASLVLAIEGMAGDDVRAALDHLGWAVLIPASVCSLATGVVLGAGTRWGLIRYYWVFVKLVMNVAATGVLLLYMGTLAGLTADDPAPVVHAGAAAALLVVATTLSVYKPRGLTPYGRRLKTSTLSMSSRSRT